MSQACLAGPLRKKTPQYLRKRSAGRRFGTFWPVSAAIRRLLGREKGNVNELGLTNYPSGHTAPVSPGELNSLDLKKQDRRHDLSVALEHQGYTRGSA